MSVHISKSSQLTLDSAKQLTYNVWSLIHFDQNTVKVAQAEQSRVKRAQLAWS